MPEYLNATGEDRAKAAFKSFKSLKEMKRDAFLSQVDYAFNALVPRAPQDPRQAAMHTWIKARLFTYNKAFPFKFSPY